MSILKTALVTALLTSSTAAMAAPGVSFSANAEFGFAASTGPAVRDHRDPIPYAMPNNTVPAWSILSSSLQLRSGMDVIQLQGRQSPTSIRVQAISGNLQIDSVAVRFRDGSVQTMNARQLITAQTPLIQFDLQANRSGVDSISILGRGNRRASYQVLSRETRNDWQQSRPIVNFAGHYTSQYGDVYLQQTGNHITGSYPRNNGTIDGYVVNGVATVTWKEGVSELGHAVFYVGANGKVEGTWGMGDSTNGSGEWDLVRAYR